MDSNPRQKEQCSPKYFVPWFKVGARTEEAVGIELEMFVVDELTGSTLPYSGSKSMSSILRKFGERGWTLLGNATTPTGTVNSENVHISLEPGCALEISTPPVPCFGKALTLLKDSLSEAVSIVQEAGARVVLLGAAPFNINETGDWLPKSRVKAQRDYFVSQAEGTSGLQVMSGICSLQLNYDFLDNHDLIEKYRVLHLLAPIAAAISANGACVDGETLPIASRRQLVWLEADKSRTGAPPNLFRDESFDLEKYVAWILNMPLMFMERRGVFSNIPSEPFIYWCTREFPDGSSLSLEDWKLHLSSVFPDVRLRQYLELRTMDTPPADLLPGLILLISSLIYDEEARKSIIADLPKYSDEERGLLYESISRYGLSANYHGMELTQFAQELLELAERSLKKRISQKLEKENIIENLSPLKALITGHHKASDRLIDAFGKNAQMNVPTFMEKFALSAEDLNTWICDLE